MKISTKGRYALRLLIDLTEQNREAYVPLKELAERQDISEKYLESIIATLLRAGIVIAMRGKGGGYQLAMPPHEITVKRVLELMEGSLAPVACLDAGHPPCPRAATCKTLPMWTELNRRISEYLDGVTVADLARGDDNTGDYII